MELARNIPLLLIIMSLFSGVLCMALRRRASKIYTVVLELLAIVLAALLLAFTCRTGESFTFVLGEFPAPWGNELRAGILESLLALAFLIVEFCSVIAGGKFLKIDVEESKINLYFSLVHLLRSALLALVFTNDIFTGYVFLEILTLTSCGILIIRQIGRTTLAAVRYMVLNLLGSGLFLLGVVLLYAITGHLLMVPMHEVIVQISSNERELMTLALSTGILTIGLGIKSGLFPFHFWMPDTYGWATPTSAALLAGLVSKGYIFLLIKIYLRVIGPDVFQKMKIGPILFGLGILGMIFGSISALRKKSINRMVAFSSAAQIGYIYMGIGIGGAAGYTAAIFHILTHAVTKALLFLTTPYLAEVSGGSLLFRNLQGSAHRARIAGIFFLVGSFSMIGIPVFAGFSSKLLFSLAAVSAEGFWKILLTMLALALSSVLNAMYFLRTMIRIYALGKGGSGTSAAAEYEKAHLSGSSRAGKEEAPAPGASLQTAPGEVSSAEPAPAANSGAGLQTAPGEVSSAEPAAAANSGAGLQTAPGEVRPAEPAAAANSGAGLQTAPGEVSSAEPAPAANSASREEVPESMPRGERFAFIFPALILTAANVFLGLFSWVVVDLIEKGLAMFF